MMSGHETTRERVLLLAALTAVLLTSTWAWWYSSHLSIPVAPSLVAGRTRHAYQPDTFAAPVAKMKDWAEPSAQPSGGEWAYEVFTPPLIYYDPALGEFSVAVPKAAHGNGGEDFSPGPHGVQREAFRLQLVGFVGGEGTYLGMFENMLTTEHFLSRGGRRVPALGLTIMDFNVTCVGINSPDSMAFTELVATAVVRDEQTGAEITLTDRERREADTLVPVVTSAHANTTVEAMEIRLMPPAVDLAGESPDSPASEIKALTPRH